ncbi:ubiquinol-cytochrome C chaperone [Stappia sp. F7233]|uniref:Ubiquinol-cytochrome C chaperone n=1 Tax=Stappia albiluteola TaxID=2758565 RepID=A0A839ABL1_9HYPH|nr:ubiquinol-cytochrome C chaperone family protein [Stappia albiluteola]MBA5776287.1 ubiquinol-cytochrome C chaperone [Stappia albiluteola]
MVFGLFRKRENPAVREIYAAIVAQARQPHFYARLRVPDTVDGRYELIMLHAILLFYRLRRESEEASGFGQAVFDLFFQDMDRSLREMGISDTRVPKKITRMAEMFYGRASVYADALDGGDHDALVMAVDRNFFPEASDPVAASAIAAYMRKSVGVLAETPVSTFIGGKIRWADPAAFDV